MIFYIATFKKKDTEVSFSKCTGIEIIIGVLSFLLFQFCTILYLLGDTCGASYWDTNDKLQFSSMEISNSPYLYTPSGHK